MKQKVKKVRLKLAKLHLRKKGFKPNVVQLCSYVVACMYYIVTVVPKELYTNSCWPWKPWPSFSAGPSELGIKGAFGPSQILDRIIVQFSPSKGLDVYTYGVNRSRWSKLFLLQNFLNIDGKTLILFFFCPLGLLQGLRSLKH